MGTLIFYELLRAAAHEAKVAGEAEADDRDEWDAHPQWADGEVEEEGGNPDAPANLQIVHKIGAVLLQRVSHDRRAGLLRATALDGLLDAIKGREEHERMVQIWSSPTCFATVSMPLRSASRCASGLAMNDPTDGKSKRGKRML